MAISPELFKDIHDTLFNGNGNVIDVKLDEDFKHIYVYFDHKEDDGKYRDIIKEVLKKYGLEIGGVGLISNWENFHKAEKEFEAANPKPIDPSEDHEKVYENGKTWKGQSYYWRAKGQGFRLMAEYRAQLTDWLAEKCSKLPPRYIPGFYFDVDALGTGAKIEAFYAGTKYWGD